LNANSVVNLTLSVTDQFSAATEKMGKAVEGLGQRLTSLQPILNALSQQFVKLGAIALGVLGTDIARTLSELEQKFERFGLSLKDATADVSDATKTELTAILSSLAPLIDSSLAGIAPKFAAVGGSITGVFQKLPPSVAASLNAVDKAVIGTISLIEEKVARLQTRTGQIGNVFGFLSGVREPIGVFKDLTGLATGAAGAIFNATQQIGLFGLGIQALGQLVSSGPLQPLIGQNVELREQLLATQATLASTNKVLSNGLEIKDPKAAILALQAPIEGVINKLREDSLDLVGVTSKDLVPLYQIVAQNAGQVGASLDQARQITVNFAATLGTLQVPLFQARQEISSILQGTIDQNSIVAKSLNLTNKQVETWKAQGTLVTELNKRLEGFRAGNALAAQTINGITSNIQEVIDEVGRLAGAQLIDPIAKQLNEIYQALKTNKEAYAAYVGDLAANGLKAVMGIVASVKAVAASTGEAFKQIPLYLFESLANAATGLAAAITTTLAVLQPFINTFAELAKVAIAAGGPFLQLFLQFKVASVAIGVMSRAFGSLVQIVEPFGSILFLLAGRTSGLIGRFSGLTSVVGTGAAGFLLAGKNLALIPGAMAAVTNAIPLFGGAIAQLIPQISQFGIGLISLSQRFPVVQELFTRFAGTIPQIALSLQSMAAANGLPLLADLFGKVGTQANFAATLNAKFSEAVTQASIAARNAAIRMGLITAAIIAAGFAFDKFVLQNKNLLNALGSFASFLKDVAGAIVNFLTNPIVAATIAVTGLTIAIQAKLIPSILALSAAAGSKLLLALLSVAGSLVGLEATLIALGPLFAGMAASAGQATTGLLAINVAATSGTLTLGGLASAVGTLALGLAGLVAPLALAAAGIAAIGLIRYTKDLKESQEAFDIYSQQANKAGDDAVAIASRLTAAKKSQEKATKDGITLSSQEFESNRKLASSGKLRLEDLKAQIKILEEAKKVAVGDELKRAFDNQIAGLTVTQKLLEGLVNTIQIAPRDLEKLGSTFEQLALKANTALKAIDNPSGDPEIFKKRVTDLIETTKVQRELGAVSFAEAKDRYLKIAQLATLDQELQQKAAKELTNLIKQEGEARAAVYDAQIKEQENRLKGGQADEIDGEKEVTRLKKEQIKVRIAAVEEQIQAEVTLGNGQSENVKTLLIERRKLEADSNALSLEDYQKTLDKQLELVQRQTARITDIITTAEIERNTAIQALVNSGEITDTKASELKLSNTRQRIARELALESAYQQELQAQQRPQDPAKAEEFEKKVRASKIKTGQLTLQLAEQEEAQQNAVAKVVQEAIERRTKAMTNLITQQSQEYQKQLQLLNRVGDALAAQNKLLEQRQSLSGAISGFLGSQLKLLADTSKSEEDKARFEKAAAVERLRFLRQEQDFARQKLEISIQQQRLQDAQALRQNQIDQLTAASEQKQAEANLAKKKADPKALPEEIEALNLDLEAKRQKILIEQQKGITIGENATLNRRGEGIQRAGLGLQQRAQLDQARVDVANTLPKDQQEGIINRIRNEILTGLGFTQITAEAGRNAAREALTGGGQSGGSRQGFTNNSTGVNTYAPDLRRLDPNYRPKDAGVLNLQGAAGLRSPGLQGSDKPVTAVFMDQLKEQVQIKQAIELIRTQLPTLSAQLLSLASRPGVQKNEQNYYVQGRNNVLAGTTL
jgi:hypothetical protein